MSISSNNNIVIVDAPAFFLTINKSPSSGNFLQSLGRIGVYIYIYSPIPPRLLQRCVTATSSACTGNGVFSTDIYIHSNVPSSDGVFTVAILPSNFTQAMELDLIVVNLSQNIMKSGKPGKAEDIAMSSFIQKWIRISLVKSSNQCQTTISAVDSGAVLHKTGYV